MPEIVQVPALVSAIIADVKVASGKDVKEGDVLAVQASTKTEYQIKATKTGRVKNIVKKGDELKEGDTVAEIEV